VEHLSHSQTSFSVRSYQSGSRVISHRITTVSTLQNIFKFGAAKILLSALETLRQSLGEEFP
jgi:hypothetical protein